MTQVYSVGEVNTYIHSLFESNARLRSISISGELSNVKYHSSGHIYYTLKDERSAIAGVMFASNARGLTFRLREGLKVVVSGSVSSFERDGKYQIYASAIRQEGAGELYERYEKLKKELREMGMFDESYKQEIPYFVRTLGVVTASTGAAVRDIINVAKRRFPYVQIVLYPAKVQGEGAKESICDGIMTLEKYGVDCMIVGRGGGSIEDLWAFNEEMVARAIFNCSVPIISAVGHETDTTIADLVADLRAPTPSAAAELAVFDYAAFVKYCLDMNNLMNHRIRQKLSAYRDRCDKYRAMVSAHSPGERLKGNRVRLESLGTQLKEKMEKRIDIDKRYAVEITELMSRAMENKLQDRKQSIALLAERLNGLSPLLKLSQGFSLTEGESGSVISSVKNVKPNERITVHVKDGCIYAAVEGIEEKSHGE